MKAYAAGSSRTGGPSAASGAPPPSTRARRLELGRRLVLGLGRGADSLPGTLAPATGVTGIVHDLNGFQGAGYQSRADLTQALWLAVLLVAGIGLLRAPYRRETLLVAATCSASQRSRWCSRGDRATSSPSSPSSWCWRMVHGSLPTRQASLS